MKTAFDKILGIACMVFILAVTVNQAALAGVRLDLGSAPLDPEAGPNVYPGDSVQIPIFLSNYDGVSVVIATSTEITYDSSYLTPLAPTLGPKGVEAGKNISSTITTPGRYLVGLYSIENLNTPILNGIVAYANFKVNNDAPAGTYTLVNSAGCTAPGGTPIPVSGTNGSIEVTASNNGTTTTTTASQVECSVTMTPSALLAASTETVQFSSTSEPGENCRTPELIWSVDSSIGSTIDANGMYTAGTNTTGAVAIETIVVTDAANETSATATVSISALPVGTLRITPDTIRSFPRRQHLQLLLIRSDEGKFSNKSELSFNPPGDIKPLMLFAAGRSIFALVAVKPDVVGSYDVKVSTDILLFLNQDSLSVGPGNPFLNSQNKTIKSSHLQSSRPVFP